MDLMHITDIAASWIAAYLLGAIPSGLLVVKLFNGKDIRQVASGRTGGTNAMRAAGFGAGLLTAILDLLKGAGAVWLVRWLAPGSVWVEAVAPLMAIMGHNYSVFLLERNSKGRLRLRGGAGGATCTGGALGLWPMSVLFILPLAGAVWYGVGFASVTTMSIGLLATLIFAYRASIGVSPWAYAFYGLASELILLWALRPNIARLLAGTERVHGWRAHRKKTIQVNTSDETEASLLNPYKKKPATVKVSNQED